MKIKNLCLLASAIVVCSISSTHAQEQLRNVGIIFNGGVDLNKTIVDAIEFVGTCPGFRQEKIVGWFIDKEVPTAKDRRVRIVNEKLQDSSERVPYTDREYQQENGKSEKIVFDFADSHKKTKFVIRPGLNEFSYVIYDGQYDKPNMQVIKKGSFSVEVNANIKKSQRDIEWNSTPRLFCLNGKGEEIEGQGVDENCKIPVAQRVGSCEGKTIFDHAIPVEVEVERVKIFLKNRLL
ncbi:MAG: hypothetical protein RMX68_013935 [Aulosira sp. ZfuVER01]|nr:hypothetical protein [Aulosira sp. ZfuVER01]MDZ7996332.1 hypothetical protein [Aulosira sp. DedVER01a]MDZ8053446.1 hypothetical protein [Aulosira sp. ZfuCHP01]